MDCVRKARVYAFLISFFVCSQGTVAHGKDSKDHATMNTGSTSSVKISSIAASPDEFRWNEHQKLTWNDFRGPVNATSDESAAATNCGIGFKTAGSTDGKLNIIVFNTFYANRSWVRSDAKLESILDHEQGHFDLCELYTRKLRQRMNEMNFNMADLRNELMNVYTQLQAEYESRQLAYEQETIHGTDIEVQKKWQSIISKELSCNDRPLVSGK